MVKTIQECIDIIEKITPEDITKKNELIDENGKGCLAGHLWLTEGFKRKDYLSHNFNIEVWNRKTFGEQYGNEITNALERIHFKYMDDPQHSAETGRRIKFETMKNRALKYLRSLL